MTLPLPILCNIDWVSATYVVVAGCLAGAVSMLVYAKLSPQEKLRVLQGEIRCLQQQLSDYDGDFAGALALSQRNLRLSLRRLGCVFWPSLAAGMPVLGILPFLGGQYVLFFVATAVSAVGVKFLGRIA